MFERSFNAVVLAAFLAIDPGFALAQGTRSCTVDQIDGTGARYWRNGAWGDLTPAMRLAPETKVSTGPDARVRVICDDRVALTIGIDTEVNLERLVGAAGTRQSVIMQLIAGILGIVAPQRNWSRFEVRTPVAIASVRSTEWLVEHGPGDGTAVFVRGGRVTVRIRHGERFALVAGEGLSVSANGKPGEVKTWGAARIAKSTERLGPGWQ